MSLIFFDFEARSRTPIHWGLDNYFKHAEPIILTWAVDDGPVQILDYTQEPIPRLPRIFREPGHTFIAHNCQFDRRVVERLFDLHRPVEDYRCTQAQAYAHGLPGSLETLGHVLGIKLQKLTGDDGHKLMLFFCTPRSILKDGSPKWNEPRDFPEKWEAFKRYAIRDTEALRQVYRKLPTWNYQGENLATWFLDQRINERGFGFDSQLAEAARKVLDAAKVLQQSRTSKLTQGAVGSVTQRQKLLDWFNASGLEIASMKASDVREALESEDLPTEHRLLLELRLEGSKSSGAKYRRGLDCVGPDGRLRDTMVYCGANRTGRWSGRTLQPQNLSRYSPQWEALNKDAPHEPIEQIVLPAILRGDVATLDAHGGVNSCCNDAIRSAIVAAPGNEFVAADWSNIEGRVLAWLADDHAQLEYFRAQDRGEAPDSYKYQWAQMFRMPVEDVSKTARQASKQLKLACNYLGGVGALITMAMGNNLDLAELMAGVLEQVPEDVRKKAKTAWRRAFLEGEDFGLAPWVYQSCDALVRLFRQANETVTKAGYGLGNVVLDAMKNPNTLFVSLKCKVWFDGHAVTAQLPCGRRLFYWNPEVREERQVDELTGHEKMREVFYYRASRGKQWRRLRGWAGLYVENFTQGVANSVLRAGLLNVQRYALQDPALSRWLATLPDSQRTPLVLHVHDEGVGDVPKGLLPREILERLLTSDLAARHPWMSGLPLAASGWQGTGYRK